MTNEAWPLRPLGELFTIGAGKTMSAAARAGGDKTPFLRTSNVLWDELDLTAVDEMAITPQELEGKLLGPGDLLVCEGGDIGRAAIWEGQTEVMSFQNHLHRLRPLLDDIEPRFYVYFLQSAFTQLGIFAGAGNRTTIPNLSRSRLAALALPHPSIQEQREIARALAHVRSALKLHERSAASAEALKRAAMHTLFTHGLRGEAQKETEIGPVPESWEVTSIGTHFSVASGGTPSRAKSEYWKGGTIPWVKTAEIDYREIHTTEERITDEGLADSAAKLFPAGTLLLAMYGQGVTRGKVGMLGIEAACNQACAAIRPQGGVVDTWYLYHYLTHRYEVLRQLAHGGQQQNLNLDIVRDFHIAFPLDKEEQQGVVTALGVIDRKIDLHRRKRAVLGELFQALLHKLMTGEIRVDQLDFSALHSLSVTGGLSA